MDSDQESRNLPLWMLKALGKPEKANGRLLVLLDDPTDLQKAAEAIRLALKDIPHTIQDSF